MDTQDTDNIKALNKLREMPRGSQVDSRIAAIQALLGEVEALQTLKRLRWPKGVVCPTCRSSRIIRRPAPKDAEDKRNYYTCLNCQEQSGGEDGGHFDDFTGLPIDSMQGITQWMLCWYLIGFCSIGQIAKILGISVHDVAEIVSLGANITTLPDSVLDSDVKLAGFYRTKKDKESVKKQKADVEEMELSGASEGKNPFKPKYKSRK